jgi:hypothetical protein
MSASRIWQGFMALAALSFIPALVGFGCLRGAAGRSAVPGATAEPQRQTAPATGSTPFFQMDCRPQAPGVAACTLEPSTSAACPDCYYDHEAIPVVTFAGMRDVSAVWVVLAPAIRQRFASPPFAMTITSQGSDELCFALHHAASTVLRPSFEDSTVCMRALAASSGGNDDGVRVRASLSLSVAENPHDPYREPNYSELDAYKRALGDAFRSATAETCGSLHGVMNGIVCLKGASP